MMAMVAIIGAARGVITLHQDPQLGGAVHARRLHQLVGHVGEIRGHDVGAERREVRHPGQDDARAGVREVQQGDQLEDLGGQEKLREDREEEHQEEQGPLQAEPHLAERIARRDAHRQVQHQAAGNEDEAVDRVASADAR